MGQRSGENQRRVKTGHRAGDHLGQPGYGYPGLYSDWLMRRLEAGYVKWINPFNRQAICILCENTGYSLLDENAKPLIKHLRP